MGAPGERESPSYSVLDRALEAALRPWHDAAEPFTLLFSGGVDSGLLAWELRSNRSMELLTIGSPGAADLSASRESAHELGLRARCVEIRPTDVQDADRDAAPAANGTSPVHRSVLVAFALALRYSRTERVLCGQGADELFLGYAHFQGLDSAEAAARSDADLKLLLEEDGPRVDRIARSMGRTVVSPYLDPRFVAAARAIPIEARMPRDAPKAFFRRWATRRGLPSPVADRRKRALQYGSGVARMLERSGPRSDLP